MAARLLRSWVRIPPRAWMFVCCECCVLSGRGLCDELITRPEESYRLWYVVVCDLETSRMRRPWPALGRSATEKKPHPLWNTKHHYRIEKNPPLFPSLSQIFSYRTFPFHFATIHSPSQLRLFPNVFLPLKFPVRNPSYVSHSFHACYVHCPSYLPWFCRHSIWRRAQNMKLLIKHCRFVQPLKNFV